MKLMHLSDLHLGKRVYEFSMLEDQRYILDEILEIAEEHQPDLLVIAGDIYDKSVPPVEAISLFDRFLVSLSNLGIKTAIISGNHDSVERVAFGGKLMHQSGVFVAPVYDGALSPLVFEDEYGPFHLYLLPFVKPAQVRRFFPEEEIANYSDAIGVVLESAPLEDTVRNLLVTHQFVAGGVICESEEVSVGGTELVAKELFSSFDYVALGHLHGPQNVTETIRYCGSPLKYSFSEANQQKSVTLVTLEEKGSRKVETIPLTPLRDLEQLKGTYEELTARSFYETKCRENYFHITLTDEEDLPDAMAKLRIFYPNLMQLSYDNRRTRENQRIVGVEAGQTKPPLAMLEEFYQLQNNRPLSEEQLKQVEPLISELWEETL